MSDRFNQKDVAGMLLLSAAVGAAGYLGIAGAKWLASVDRKKLKKALTAKVAPPLLYAGFETSRRLTTWFGHRVVTMDQLKPGMDPHLWAAAVDRVRTVIDSDEYRIAKRRGVMG